MEKTNVVVEFKMWGYNKSFVEVLTINGLQQEETYYFTYQDFLDNLNDLVEVVTDLTNYNVLLKKVF